MKKICLSVVGVFLLLFSGFAQKADSSSYKSRKLSFDEANIVSSYYHQDGNNSAVTGGIGSEKLTDLSNSIDLKLYKYDRRLRKHNFDLELGIDHYTSASSDKIDPHTLSSASHADTRIYPSFNWTMENQLKGTTVGAGLSFSNEFDYTSLGGNINFSKKTADRNGEFTAKAQVFLDQVKLIYPIELRTRVVRGGEDDGGDYASTSRNSYSGSLSYTQVINPSLQVALLADLIYQKGYLGLPFHRVYFSDNSVHVENLPGTRMKIPLGFRANYFIGDKIIIRSFYRFYHDDWGINAHTFNIETPVKLTPFLSVAPFYRYYTQSAADYFAPYQAHTVADQFYTSNYDLGKFNSQFFGAGFRIMPPNGVFGLQHLNMLELRYGHYTKTTGMNANIISVNLRFK